MSSLAFLTVGLVLYLLLALKSRDWLAPAALLCVFWFAAAALADVDSLKDSTLQHGWEPETYAIIYLAGLSMFAVGFVTSHRRYIRPIKIDPSTTFRRATTLLMFASLVAVAIRLLVFGFSLEQLLLDLGGADVKAELTADAVPGIFYFELMTPYLCLCAIFELSAATQMTTMRRIGLVAYSIYATIIYCIVLSASRGTLLVILTGALFLYVENGHLRFRHLLLMGITLVGAMSGLSFLRMSSESISNSFLGDSLFQSLLSPIYTYIAFNFENLNSLVRADLDHTYVFYSLKFLLWPLFKADYLSGNIRLTDFNTLFFNARTFLYGFYHDLGIFGCVFYPALIALVVTKLHNSMNRNPSRTILLMSLQKPIWFAFFGNYFFGELVIFVPLLVLGLLGAVYQPAHRPHPSSQNSRPQSLRPSE